VCGLIQFTQGFQHQFRGRTEDGACGRTLSRQEFIRTNLHAIAVLYNVDHGVIADAISALSMRDIAVLEKNNSVDIALIY
jgi:hypothetical protein